jgi:hypothetical protein
MARPDVNTRTGWKSLDIAKASALRDKSQTVWLSGPKRGKRASYQVGYASPPDDGFIAESDNYKIGLMTCENREKDRERDGQEVLCHQLDDG